MNDTAIRSASTAQTYTVPPAGSPTDGRPRRASRNAGEISSPTSAPSRTRASASSSASWTQRIFAASPGDERSSNPSASSAQTPWVGGGSSQTSTPLYSSRSGSTQRGSYDARSSSSSQVAEQIASATSPV
jgi:hypothetical protein